MQYGGATAWARQTVTSEVFLNKPDKWFKIWFYIVTRANYKTTRGWNRGECFMQSSEIENATGASKDQVKKCLRWLRDKHSISTSRSTRGMHIKVLKYNVYQDFNNYRSTREAPEKHQRSTPIVEEGKKGNNLCEPKGSANKELTNNEKDMWNITSDDFADEVSIDLDGDGTLVEEKKKPARKYPNAPAVRKIFQEVLGVNLGNWKTNKNQLQACENLYTELGIKKIRNALEYYKEHKEEKYCPIINSPHDLDGKYAKLSQFKTKKES